MKPLVRTRVIEDRLALGAERARELREAHEADRYRDWFLETLA